MDGGNNNNNSILYYSRAEPTAARPITDSEPYRYLHNGHTQHKAKYITGNYYRKTLLEKVNKQSSKQTIIIIIIMIIIIIQNRDSAIGTETGYALDGPGVGVRVPVRAKVFSSPRRPDRLWGPPSLVSNGYRGLFPRR
jgi:hypothetical protein